MDVHLSIMVLISPHQFAHFSCCSSGYLVKCLINALGIYLIIGTQAGAKQQ